MNEKPKNTNILLVIGLILMLIINLSASRRIANLESVINNINENQFATAHDIRRVASEIWELNSRLDSLGEDLTQTVSLSFGQQIQIQSYNAEATIVNVRVSFNLREFTPGDGVTITAICTEGQLIIAQASASLDGRFFAYMDLPVQESYVLTFTTAGDRVTTGEITSLNLGDMLGDRFTFYTSQGTTSGTGRPTHVNLWPSLRNYTQGNQALGIQELNLTLETDGYVAMVWDLTPYLCENGRLQVEEGLGFYVSDEEGHISPDTVSTITRLTIVDNLGIRYEQIDHLFLPYWREHTNWIEAGGSSITQHEDDWQRIGRVRIME